jgi:hypothetical protein
VTAAAEPTGVRAHRADEDVARHVRNTRTEQGLPEKVEDPATIERIAQILRGGA